jgi:hypothetical protein
MKNTEKLGEFKVITRVTSHALYIAYKQKGGLTFTVSDYKFEALVGQGFTFYLGKDFTQVTYCIDDKGRHYLEFVQPAKDERVKFHPVGKDAYLKFTSSDYNGKQI